MSVPDQRKGVAFPALLIAGFTLVYLLIPAAPSSVLGAWPLTPLGLAVFCAAAGLAYLSWPLPRTGARLPLWLTAFVMLIVLRLSMTAVVIEPGWLASYYANDSWSGQPQWSSDFRDDSATRIDRELSFAKGDFPVHYLNGPAFTEGAERDIVEPMSVQWRGVVQVDAKDTVTVELNPAGFADVTVDGAQVLSTQEAATRSLTLDAGRHAISVRYRKPADSAGAFRFDLRRQSNGETIEVLPEGSTARRLPAAERLSQIIDGVVMLLLAIAAIQALMLVIGSGSPMPVLLGSLVVIGLGVQGFLTALPFARFYTLTGGDDWLGFESRARDILQHGLLMPVGAAIGSGVPYFYHPFYSYFLAGVHALAGESLFGPIFIHFILLAITAVLMFSLARGLFGSLPAGLGVAALIVIFELDFVRYYTITLLSENLYVLTVTCCLVALARWAETGRTAALVQAGIWGGISAATRPVMMVFLPLALVVVALIAHRDRRQPGPVIAALIAGTAWMACILPFTVRNWIVAREFVLISAGQGAAVIAHNVPPALDPAPYLAAFRTGQAGTLTVLWNLFIEHPTAMIALQIKKLGFTLGMIHWFDGYRPHPELLAVSALYLLMLVLSRPMRRPELWPVHAFVASHWASMALTSPWNYGYRLILPPYVYTTTLSCAAAASMMMKARR